MQTVRSAFYTMAKELGLDTIFGNPGSTEETLLKEFPKDMSYILALHEASAVAMADAYALRTGRPSLVNLHTAAGISNALSSIQTAHYNHSPVIVTAGQQTREMLLHEPFLINSAPTQIAAPYVKWAYETVRAEDAPAALMRAYAATMQAPMGPVLLSIPMDDFEKPFNQHCKVRKIEGRLGADIGLLDAVLEALKRAKNPALIVGAAVDRQDGWQDGVRLAEKLNAKVWAGPFEGRPGFPETHSLYQGVLPPAIAELSKALTGCDVILVIGAPVFRYYPFSPGAILPAETELFHITDDPTDVAAAWVGTSFLADPARACKVLADALTGSKSTTAKHQTTVEKLESAKKSASADKPAPATPMTPDFVYATIQEKRPADSIILQESLSTLKALKKWIPTSASNSFYSFSSGVLGYGLPAAIGVALAETKLGTNRKIIAIIGDGSANYTIQALWTAAQKKADILFIIMVNKEYDILKSFAQYLGADNVPGLDIGGINFVEIAKAYGVSAQKVENHEYLGDVLEACLKDAGPTLLEVHIDKSVPQLLK